MNKLLAWALAPLCALLATTALAQTPPSAPIYRDGAGQLQQSQGVFVLNVDGSAAQAVAPKGFQSITSLSSSTALTVPTGATTAVITAETQGVRWRDDGTAPTATVGFPLAAGQSMTVRGSASIAAIRFIEQSASASLNVSYYQ
jgi:hypothetical protein